MKKRSPAKRSHVAVPHSLPVIIEKDADGYVVECPIFPGCYSQGDTYDEALRNIQEVIELVLEEEESRAILRDYLPHNISFHTITIEC
jgi:predicted RNase H-like HicB family nuclease